MHSFLKFKLKFSRGGIKDFETTAGQDLRQRSELRKCLNMCEDLSEERFSRTRVEK